MKTLEMDGNVYVALRAVETARCEGLSLLLTTVTGAAYRKTLPNSDIAQGLLERVVRAIEES